jgi:hypothetical protein
MEEVLSFQKAHCRSGVITATRTTARNTYISDLNPFDQRVWSFLSKTEKSRRSISEHEVLEYVY